MENTVPQGLKPIDFISVIGTTEVVPCYKATEILLIRKPQTLGSI